LSGRTAPPKVGTRKFPLAAISEDARANRGSSRSQSVERDATKRVSARNPAASAAAAAGRGEDAFSSGGTGL